MKKNETCPLCSCKSYFVLDKIKVSEIANEYHSSFNIKRFFWNLDEIQRLECSDCGIIFFDYVIEWDSDYYKKISWWHKYYSLTKRDFDQALELIKEYKPSSLLEIWCWNGYFLEKIQYIVDNIAGTELSVSAIETCQKKWINIIDLYDETKYWKYDMIVTFQVFEHINDAYSMIIQTQNLLKEWWIFIIAVPNPHWYLWKVRDFLNLPPHHPLWWTKNSFEYLKNYNFTMVSYIEENLSYRSFLHYIYYGQDLPKSRFFKCVSKIQKYWLYFIWPSLYDEKKFTVKWHTHIWIFQKNNKQ